MNTPPLEQSLPSEVVAFCSLLARIMYRCLAEQDERLLALLSLPPTQSAGDTSIEQSEVAHEQVA